MWYPKYKKEGRLAILFAALLAFALSASVTTALAHAEVTGTESSTPNVILTMDNLDSGLRFSAQSYDKKTDSFVDCRSCGAIVKHDFNSVDMRKPYIALKRGTRVDRVVSGSYFYQEWNQQGWVENGKNHRSTNWRGGKLKMFRTFDGVEMELRYVEIQLLNPRKPHGSANAKGGVCDPAVFADCEGAM